MVEDTLNNLASRLVSHFQPEQPAKLGHFEYELLFGRGSSNGRVNEEIAAVIRGHREVFPRSHPDRRTAPP